MRAIDADKLHPDIMTNDFRIAISQSQIANAPTLDIKFVHGHWVKREPYPSMRFEYECSECSQGTDDNSLNYCPYCGAHMQEVK